MKDHGQDARPSRQARPARPERLIVLGVELNALARLVGDHRFQKQSLRRQRHPAGNTRRIHGR
jgi:hypothetical protein